MNADEINEKIKKHPCYCAGAHLKYSRIHLPVAPKCNIQCNYCNRKFDCAAESRPGVTSGVLSPQEALETVIAAKHETGSLSVVGIAGPGDALANPEETFAAFRLIRNYDKNLHLCLSTNGLRLAEYADEIKETGIEHVTVTLNAVDAEIGAQIYEHVSLDGRKTGVEAAQILIDRQIEGIKALVERDILVKINTVLIPGVNDHHIPVVARKIKELGAFIHNILPLLSKKEFGTKFSEMGIPEPDCAMLGKVRSECEEVMGGPANIMSHCKQCRADAVGKIGEQKTVSELGRESHYGEHTDKVMTAVKEAAAAKVASEYPAYRQALESVGRVKAAVATKGGAFLDVNFGKSRDFNIYEVSADGVVFLERRTIIESETAGRMDAGISGLLDALGDSACVVYKKIGNTAADELENYGVKPVTAKAYITCEEAAWQGAKEILNRLIKKGVLI